MFVVDVDGTLTKVEQSETSYKSYNYILTDEENGQQYALRTHFQGSCTDDDADGFASSSERISTRVLIDSDEHDGEMDQYDGMPFGYLFVAQPIQTIEIDLNTPEGQAMFKELFAGG